jgi:hypothetical protein
MKPIDLKDLINGIITIIIIALSIGQYTTLRSFAKREFAQAMSTHSSVRRGDVETIR